MKTLQFWVAAIIVISTMISCEKGDDGDNGDGIPTKEISLGAEENKTISDFAIQSRKNLKLGYIWVDQMITDPNGNLIPQTVINPQTGLIDTVRIQVPITVNSEEDRIKSLVTSCVLDLKVQIINAIHNNPDVRTKFVFPTDMSILSRKIKNQISGGEESFVSRLETNGINDLSALVTIESNKDKTIDELIDEVVIGSYEEELLKAAAIDFFENEAIKYLQN